MNGIYHADFVTALGRGGGTVYLENGILRGGDAVVAYFGAYTSDGSCLTAQVKTILHGQGFSVLGNADKLFFQGNITNKTVEGVGVVPESPLQVKIVLRKVSELPEL